MSRGPKIIQISGFRGILTAIFIVTCLAAGFVIFPGYVAMNLWNKFAGYTLPQINIYQGVLLWAIIAIIYYLSGKRSIAVSFSSPKELNEEELNVLMERIRLQSQAKMINKSILEEKEKTEAEKQKTANK